MSSFASCHDCSHVLKSFTYKIDHFVLNVGTSSSEARIQFDSGKFTTKCLTIVKFFVKLHCFYAFQIFYIDA
jgi:hypothetical protein